MKIALKATRLGLRNSQTRIPFRYGQAVLSRCPQAILEATIEHEGNTARGYSGDCLPPSWFDKSPGKDFAAQIADMLAVIDTAEKVFRSEFAAEVDFFPSWLAAYHEVQRRGAERGFAPLLASFGAALVERAMMDAMCRAAGLGFAQAAREDLFGLNAGRVHPELAGRRPADWLPQQPRRWIWVRHTVGLGDPLSEADIAPDERLSDGFPQALEEYIAAAGVQFLKVKVSNRLDEDLARLEAIAAIVQRHRGDDYHLTLDGNEQYKSAAEFDELIDAIRSRSALGTLWKNTLVIEQPLARDIALTEEHTGGIRELGSHKPVIIDESDDTLESYRRAIELGYRGVSSKCCKGPVKSILNAGLTWHFSGSGAGGDFLMTGEDLCTVGVVPVQQDLCLAATLGLAHVERNGHHFHPGLSYLPPKEQEAALAAHPDFYERRNGRVAPRLEAGRFHIASLHGPGFGFGALPDMDSLRAADEWEFASLGL